MGKIKKLDIPCRMWLGRPGHIISPGSTCRSPRVKVPPRSTALVPHFWERARTRIAGQTLPLLFPGASLPTRSVHRAAREWGAVSPTTARTPQLKCGWVVCAASVCVCVQYYLKIERFSTLVISMWDFRRNFSKISLCFKKRLIGKCLCFIPARSCMMI